jgi:hypothetical protein
MKSCGFVGYQMIIGRQELLSVRKDLTLKLAKSQSNFIIFNPVNMIWKKVLFEMVLPCPKYVLLVNLYFSKGTETISKGMENISRGMEMLTYTLSTFPKRT